MNEPKRGEIRKAERLACKLTGKMDCRVTGYYTEGANGDFQTFQCEICSNDMEDREDDIYGIVLDKERLNAYIDAAIKEMEQSEVPKLEAVEIPQIETDKAVE